MDGYQVVAVSTGEYVEEVDLIEGIDMVGGFDANFGWSAAAENESLIRNGVVRDGRISGITASNIAEQTQIIRMTIESEDAAENNLSSYGLYGRNVPGLVVRNSIIRAGRGGAGDDGANGEAGENGENGGQGGNCGAEQAKAVRASVARPVFGAVRARDERPAGMMENPVGVAVEAVTEATLVLAMMVKRAVTARQALPEKPETKDSPPPLEMGNGRRAERVLVGLEGAVSVAAAAEAAAVVQ